MNCKMIVIKEGNKGSVEEFNNFVEGKNIIDVYTVSRPNADIKTMIVKWE